MALSHWPNNAGEATARPTENGKGAMVSFSSAGPASKLREKHIAVPRCELFPLVSTLTSSLTTIPSGYKFCMADFGGKVRHNEEMTDLTRAVPPSSATVPEIFVEMGLDEAIMESAQVRLSLNQNPRTWPIPTIMVGAL